jgi:hypothetical protein
LACADNDGNVQVCPPCERMPASKSVALDALGVRGYAAFDKPGALYVVCAKLSPVILAHANPLVPLPYKVGQASDQKASSSESWATADHFQQGAMPGFTSGLKAELVMNTFKLTAATASDLKLAGVTCLQLADE